MALKDWKKSHEDENRIGWKQIKYPSNGYPMSVEVIRLIGDNGKPYYLVYYGPHDTVKHTKSEALKFAKDYMRKH